MCNRGRVPTAELTCRAKLRGLLFVSLGMFLARRRISHMFVWTASHNVMPRAMGRSEDIMTGKQRFLMNAFAMVMVAAWILPGVAAAQAEGDANGQDSGTVSVGTLSIEFSGPALEQLGWDFIARGSKEGDVVGGRMTFPVLPSSTLRFQTAKDPQRPAIVGTLQTRGGLLLTGVGGRVVIGNMMVTAGADGAWTVSNMLGDSTEHREVFALTALTTDESQKDHRLRMVGELSPTRSWAEALGFPEAAGVTIGVVSIEIGLDSFGELPRMDESPQPDPTAEQEAGGGPQLGPDLVVGDIFDSHRYDRVGGITAYAVGTNVCNYGDQDALWVGDTNEHPAISQSMYRLKDGRFEQIGLSWVKHGFYAVSQDFCSLGCPVPTDGATLGVGCSDPYSAFTNGQQGNMSLRSDVNAHTGYFPYPWTAPEPTTLIDKRLQVHDADLDPDLNVGASYFVQGHYTSPDDAAWGNGDNNASYRRIEVTENPAGSNNFNVSLTGSTQRGEPAIRAWADNDSLVHEADVRVPGEGLFLVAMRPTELAGNVWHYDYALQNLNSDRSGQSFTVQLPEGATVDNIGFHDVDYHSGEIYDLTDWTHSVGPNAITWSTDSYDVNPNGNALRFGTLYSFRFDADFEPQSANVTIGLFKPGDPSEVTVLLEVGCTSSSPTEGSNPPNIGFGTKNRYVSFGIMPHEPGKQHAMQVTLVSLPGYEYAETRTMWVQEPAVVTESSGSSGPAPPPTCMMARLGCSPFWTDWLLYDLVHVYDDSVIPGGVYEIRSIGEGCNLAEPGDYSLAIQVDLSAVGDIVGDCAVRPCGSPNGVVNFVDISAAVEKFKNLPSAPIKARADVTSADVADPIPDLKVDFVDISYIVEAFRSEAVPPPGPPTVDPCGR